MWRPKKARRGIEYDDMLILLTTIVMLSDSRIPFELESEVLFYLVVLVFSNTTLTWCSTSRITRSRACFYQKYLSARFIQVLWPFQKIWCTGKIISDERRWTLRKLGKKSGGGNKRVIVINVMAWDLCVPLLYEFPSRLLYEDLEDSRISKHL